MYVKRLEIQGYKTFASRTEFEFDAGITAIVGPNGSGKSNIADALRWVLGEQRYGALRAKRSADMIFAGSQARTRVGMADVSLTLDNSNGWLPIDYAEVTVQRRAFRSGENQYLLNGSRVRRKDVVELLAKGGVSSNTYTIIAQMEVDASLGMRPEERRAIFEEAAGISIHQAKRDQSLAKLEDTRNNILRVNDIINEIAPRLDRLSSQAERAREYQELSRELEELLETWHGYGWRRAHEQLERTRADEETRQQALDEQKRGLEEISRQIDVLRNRQAELRGDLGRWHSESGRLHGQLEELQRELAVKRERQRLLIQRSDEIGQELPPLVASRDGRLERIQELEAELERLAHERARLDAEKEIVQKEMTDLQDERRTLESQITAAQDQAFELATGLAERRNRLSQLRERKEELSQERAEHAQVIDDLKSQLEDMAQQIGALDGEREAILAKVEELKAKEAKKEAAAQSAVDKKAELSARLEEVRQQLSGFETRNEILSAAQQDLTGYSRGVKTVLSHRNELRGLIGTVAELLEVPADLDLAIGGALGNRLQAVVTETWDDACSALESLQANDGGRATFLPVDSVRVAPAQRIPAGKGVVGLAADLVGIREGLEDVAQALLGTTLVVEDLDAARRLHREHSGLHLVTVRGELLSRSGLLHGGSGEAAGTLLAHERERRELPGRIEALRVDVEALEREAGETQHVHQALQDEAAALRDEYSELEEAIKSLDEDIASRRLREERASQEIEWHTITVNRLREETDTLDEREEGLRREIETAEAKERETTQALDSLQEQLASLDLGPLQDKLGGLRTGIAVLERSRESQQTALEGHRAGLEQLEEQLAAKESRTAELAGEAEELELDVAALTSQVEELSDQAGNLSALIGPAEQELSDLEQEQRRLEKNEEKTRRRLQAYESAYSQSVLKRQRREDELRNLRERIEADLEAVAMSSDWPTQLPLDMDARLRSLPVVSKIPRGLESRIKELRKRVRQLGPVDPETVTEYQEVLERHSFLVAQVEDLEKAGESLRKVIAELDRLMEDKFLATFNKVAKEFKTYFTRLFNGGSGEILLTEPENPLASAVEIVAQPPGRRRTGVAVLSGGERALTGVALTFAILKSCETPFCLMDEVDSRLDEVNIGRFREALQELAENTQVIVITHNRGTLEIADSIYGITMGGDSASRVLSLRLEEVEERAS
jgi:chromosome segregation protein